jgi:hypothetical protein
MVFMTFHAHINNFSMFTRHLFVQILTVIIFLGKCTAQSSGLDFLNNSKAAADAIKKNSPDSKPRQKSGFPPAYDNSWRVNLRMERVLLTHPTLAKHKQMC